MPVEQNNARSWSSVQPRDSKKKTRKCPKYCQSITDKANMPSRDRRPQERVPIHFFCLLHLWIASERRHNVKHPHPARQATLRALLNLQRRHQLGVSGALFARLDVHLCVLCHLLLSDSQHWVHCVGFKGSTIHSCSPTHPPTTRAPSLQDTYTQNATDSAMRLCYRNACRRCR